MTDNIMVQSIVIFKLVFEEEQELTGRAVSFNMKVVVEQMSVNSTYLYIKGWFPAELNGI